MSRTFLGFLGAALIGFPAMALAQAEAQPPREFPAFRGTWVLDQSAGTGHIAGLPLARTLVIATTPTEISVAKDAWAAEVYRVDGSETSVRGDLRGSMLLVADALALTTRNVRCCQRGYAFTNVITDAYSVAGDTLTVERQLSVVVQPAGVKEGRADPGPGRLATLQDPNNNRQTIVYRRAVQPPGR